MGIVKGSYDLIHERGIPLSPRTLIKVGVLAVVLVIVFFVPFYPFSVGGDFQLLPVNQLGIRAQVTSDIKEVFVEEGDWVKEGDPLVMLLGRDQMRRQESLKASLDEAHSRLKLLEKGPKPEEVARAEQAARTAETAYQYSTREADRAEKMYADKAISEQDYQAALQRRDVDREELALAKKNLSLVKSGAREEEIEAVKAEIRRLEVDLAHADEDVKLTTLVSPIEGRIITPGLKEKIGQRLAEGDLFAVIENARTIIAEIKVPEEDIGAVAVGASVKFKLWAYPAEVLKGKVVAIAPVAFEQSRGRVEQRTLSEREMLYETQGTFREQGKVVRVLSELSNEHGRLKTDMTGYAKIQSGNRTLAGAFLGWIERFFRVEVWSWIP
ncbi:MAG TPA: efflux RND transporter periplasmic adaptor subunit [Thermodesulfobacteriota bacterium]|nr:efflux RND transporter periplasmic adaptor subunit [Deltaproteobacteria bacterium]HNU70206.1 efflux RND transporter periplasmic adaptor subunit [Thermodesulfobacteriota bacterium]